jgi:hypothetical protein
MGGFLQRGSFWIQANAPTHEDVLGSLAFSILCGHTRYAHVKALRFDAVNPAMPGMKKVVSEDSARRNLKKLDQMEARKWQRKHLRQSQRGRALIIDILSSGGARTNLADGMGAPTSSLASLEWRPRRTPLFRSPSMANTSKVLQGRAQAELAAGRPENAFQDVQTILALARAARSAPFLITVFVESSIWDRASQVISDGLERHAWTDARLADFSSELSRTDLLARLSNGLRGERAFVIQLDGSRTNLFTLQGLPDTGTLRL